MPGAFQAPAHMISLDMDPIEGINLNGGKKVSFATWCADLHAHVHQPEQ